jgi:hypothetical protein
MAILKDAQAEMIAFGDRYGKLGFAVSVLNTVLLLVILLK